MATPILPRAQSVIASTNGWTTREWYDFFRSLLELAAEGTDQAAIIQEILARLQALEDDSGIDAVIQGFASINVAGTLAGGIVQITLQGDNADPGNTYYYGTGPDGVKGFFPIADALIEGDGIALTVGLDGKIEIAHGDTSSVTDISASFTGGTVPDQIAMTFDTFGHVLTRTITGRTLDHNDTGALQGGSATERYHFTAAEHAGLLPWASEDPDDYALITQTITNGDTTHAPSGDAVFDSLALKYDKAGGTVTGAFSNAYAGNVLAVFESTDNAAVQFRLKSNSTNRRFIAVNSADAQQSQIELGNTEFTFFGPTNATVLFHSNTTQLDPGTDNVRALGSASLRWSSVYANSIRPGSGAVIWTAGTGSPEGVIVAPVGSLFSRTNGGVGTTLYVKEFGAGNTGWVSQSTSGSYVPTTVGGVNIASTSGLTCNWVRGNNAFTLSGAFNATPTASGTVATVTVPLPISTNFTTATDCGGTAATKAVGDPVYSSGQIGSTAGSNTLVCAFLPTTTNQYTIRFSIVVPILP